MTNSTISRRGLFAIFIGFLIKLSIGIITSAITFWFITSLARSVSVPEFSSASYKQLFLSMSWILRVVSFISSILAGITVGWIAREKGWLYGGLLGILLQLISIGIVSLTYLLSSSLIFGATMPAEAGYALAQKSILNQLLDAPLSILLMAVSGWLGESLYTWKYKQLTADKIILKQVLLLIIVLALSLLMSTVLPKVEYEFPNELKIPTGQTVIFGKEIKIPKEAPRDLPIYQNGKVTRVISDETSTIISIETTDELKSVLDWHKHALVTNRWRIRSENYFVPPWEDTGDLWFENDRYTGQVTVSNRNHANPEKPTETVRINIAAKVK